MTARLGVSLLHLLTAGYVSLRPLSVGIDSAGQQKGQLFSATAENPTSLNPFLENNVTVV